MNNSTAHDVATLLQGAGFGAIGLNIFVDEFNAKVNEQILITNTGGIASELKDGYEQPTFQIIVKGSRNAASMFVYDLTNQIHNYLIGLQDRVIVGETEYEGFECNGGIIALGRDANQCFMCSDNFYTFRNPE